MTKRELVMKLAGQLNVTQQEAFATVQTMLDTIIESLAEGERLEIRNFGVFEVKSRGSRLGRNPRTGESVNVETKRIAVFKPGKALKERVLREKKPHTCTVTEIPQPVMPMESAEIGDEDAIPAAATANP